MRPRGAALLVALACTTYAVPAVAEPLGPPEDALATDGQVYDMTRLGGRVYIRGSFEHVGRFTGSGLGLDPAAGALDRSFAAIDGQISDVVSDGEGGWFVGGDFDEVDNLPHARLAHIRADGTLDSAFDPAVDGLVTSLARDGNRLYLGGFFSHVDGAFRQGAAAVSTADGTLGEFDPHQAGRVTELAFAPATARRGARVYIGAGEIAAVDPTTGAPAPGFSSDVHANIRALTVSGDRLYVGGNGLVALDSTTGDRDAGFKATPRDLADEAAFTGTVHVLSVDGGRLLAGGDFNALGGATGPLVALDLATGRADRTFTPQVGTPAASGTDDGTTPDRGVFDIARVGPRLWVGGLFDQAGGSAATNLVAVDPETGRRLDVTPPLLDGQVNALEPGATRLFAGGQFAIAGYRQVSGFAAVSASTAELDPAFVAGDDCCGPLSAGAGRVFMSTRFSEGYTVGIHPSKRRPHPRYYPSPRPRRIGAVDPATGAAVPGFADLRVLGLSATAIGPDELYAASRRQSRVRFPHNRIVVIDPADGAVKRSYDVPLPGYVTNMAVQDGALYVAGSFRRFRSDGQPAHLAILKLDPRDGTLDASFDPHAHGPVYDLATRSDSIYFAGLFDSVQGERRRGIAAVFPQLGLLAHTFDPPPSIKGDNRTLLTALARDVVYQNGFTRFLGRYSGALRPESAEGFANDVDVATPTPGGLVYAATITLPLFGSTESSLSFVAPATR